MSSFLSFSYSPSLFLLSFVRLGGTGEAFATPTDDGFSTAGGDRRFSAFASDSFAPSAADDGFGSVIPPTANDLVDTEGIHEAPAPEPAPRKSAAAALFSPFEDEEAAFTAQASQSKPTAASALLWTGIAESRLVQLQAAIDQLLLLRAQPAKIPQVLWRGRTVVRTTASAAAVSCR